MIKFYVGLDLGQANDYTALSILERIEPTSDAAQNLLHPPENPPDKTTAMLRALNPARGGGLPHVHCRHLERVRGLPYPEIVDKVSAIMHTPALQGNAVLIIDQTGCGRPVFDMFEQAKLSPVGAQIHGGDNTTHEGNLWRVPKRDLVGVLQVLIQSERLKISKRLQLGPILQAEMLNFKVKIDPITAHDSYSAWRDNEHDDLVLSVALACWYANQPQAERITLKFGEIRACRPYPILPSNMFY